MIELTKEQLQNVINDRMRAQEGMNEVLEVVLNGLMYSERATFLASDKTPNNKANGYRPISAYGYGRMLSLAVPRDRLGLFQPFLTMILREHEEEKRVLCFELYKGGLSTRKIGGIMEKIYGKIYSKSAISQMSQTFKEILEKWRKRPLERRYCAIYLDAMLQLGKAR